MEYRFEEVRLASFKEWPVPFINPKDLAAAGFYYTKQSDCVKCFECNTEICKWEVGDDPMIEHERWGGRCRFIRKFPCGNVSIGTDPKNIPPAVPRSYDICGPFSKPESHETTFYLHSNDSLWTQCAGQTVRRIIYSYFFLFNGSDSGIERFKQYLETITIIPRISFRLIIEKVPIQSSEFRWTECSETDIHYNINFDRLKKFIQEFRPKKIVFFTSEKSSTDC